MKKISILIFAALMLFACGGVYADYSASQLSGEGNVQLLRKIGVEIPDKADGDSVTRAEFVSALMDLTGNNAAATVKMPFSDIPEDYAQRSKISYAYSAGVISAASEFRPDDAVTSSEAYTMVVKLLGRKNEAELGGGYPKGYEAAAARLDITKNITGTGELSFSDMCTMLVNIGQCKLFEIKDGETYTGDKTLFENNFDIHYIRAVVTADENTGLYDAEQSAPEGYVMLDGIPYLYDGRAPLGFRVCGYVRGSDGDEEIVYIEPYKTRSVRVKDIEVSGGKIKYTDDKNADRSVSVNEPAAIIYNGKAANKTALDELNDLTDTASFELIDNDNDGKYEVIVVSEYKSIVVKSVNLTDKKLVGENSGKQDNSFIDMSASDVKLTVESAGGTLSLSDIRSGALVSAYVSQDKKLIRLYINNNSVSGAAESINSGEMKIKIGGEAYDYSDYFKANYIGNIALGAEYTFLLTDSGVVEAIGTKASLQMRYAYLVKVIYNEDDEVLKIKLYTEDGKNEVFDGAEKIKLDNVLKKRSEIASVLGKGQNTSRQLIRFMTDDSGEIKYIDTCGAKGRTDKNANPYDMLTRFVFPAGAYEKLYWIKDTNSFHPYVYLSAQTKIFVVDNSDNADDDKRAALKSSNYFENNRNQQIVPSAQIKNVTEFYDVTANGVVGAMVVYDNAASDPKVENNSPVGIVYEISTAVSPDEETTYAITMFTEGRYEKYYLTDEAVKKFDEGGINSVQKGDLMRYVLTGDNRISALSCDYDMSEKKLNYTLPDNTNGTHLAKGVLYSGILYDYDGNMITIIPTGVPGITPDASDETARFSFRFSRDVYVVEPDGKFIYVSDSSEMLPYLQAGKENSSTIFIRTSDGQPEFAVIYK